MNPFGMAAGEIPEGGEDRVYDAATVFKNFGVEAHQRKGVTRATSHRGNEYVVEVKRHRRVSREG